jgi:hypothetical protein
MCQVFVGCHTDVTDVYPLQTEKQFVNTLEDNIRDRGAPSKLLSDRAQVEISGRALELLQVLSVPQWQSEPHHQWQNYAERRIQFIKQVSNTIMDRTGAPPEMWLLCLMYVAFLLNHMWSDSVKNVPLTALTGTTVDISVLLRFSFWEKVYYKAIEPGFPSDSTKEVGYVVGISEHVGHALCYKVYNPRTKKVLHRSRCMAIPPDDPHFQPDMLSGEAMPRSLIKSL